MTQKEYYKSLLKELSLEEQQKAILKHSKRRWLGLRKPPNHTWSEWTLSIVYWARWSGCVVCGEQRTTGSGY